MIFAMKNEYKKQHIVPQAYLKRFAFLKDGKYLIGVRYKDSSDRIKLFSASTKDIGYLENYYDTQAKTDPKFWEHYLDKNFDTLCGKPLDNIIAKIMLSVPERKVLTDNDKTLLSRIIVSQMIRVPIFLDSQTANIQSIKDEFKISAKKLPVKPEIKEKIIKGIELSCIDEKSLIFEHSFDEETFNKYCNILTRKIWIVYFNTASKELPFCTSDNPVFIKGISSGKVGLGNAGLQNDETVIQYALTPRIQIAIYTPKLFWGDLAELDGKKIIMNEDKYIIDFNIGIINNCFKHSFLPKDIYISLNANDRRITS